MYIVQGVYPKLPDLQDPLMCGDIKYTLQILFVVASAGYFTN